MEDRKASGLSNIPGVESKNMNRDEKPTIQMILFVLKLIIRSISGLFCCCVISCAKTSTKSGMTANAPVYFEPTSIPNVTPVETESQNDFRSIVKPSKRRNRVSRNDVVTSVVAHAELVT